MYDKSVIVYAVSCYFSCHSFRKAALLTSVPKSTIHFWVYKLRSFFEKKERKRSIMRCRKRKREQLSQAVISELEKQPFHTLKTLRDAVGASLSVSSVARIVRDAGFFRKKASWRIGPRNNDNEKVAFLRNLQTRALSCDQSSTLVSIDETGFCTTQLPIRGYSRVGKRLRASKTQRVRIHLSCAMAIDDRGNVSYHLEHGAYNGTKFYDFVKHLYPCPKGSGVILDNVAFHKSRKVRNLLRRRSLSILFTPPYSPECNPIELFFPVVKRHLNDILLHAHVSSENDFRECVICAIEKARRSCRISSLFSFPEFKIHT